MSVDNRTQLNACENENDSWAGNDSVSNNSLAGLFYEGSQGLSTQLSNALERMTCSTIGGTRDLSDASVWFLVKDNLADIKANGGHQIVLDDGTDEIGFYTNGNDNPPLTLESYFFCLKLDVSNRAALSNNAYSGSAANLTVSSITGVGYGSQHTAKAQGAIDNVFLDRFTFIANTSYALTINGGTSGTPETFADVSGDDVTNGWGMIANLQGNKYDINASWEWGDTANADSYFVDSDFQLFIDARDMGVGNFLIRTIAGTGTNELELTNGLFQNLGTGAVWDLTDADMNVLKFSGCTWTDAATISFPVQSTSNRFVNDCVFNNCGQIDFSTIDVDNLLVNGSSNADGAVLFNASGDSDNIIGATFNSDGTGHAIEITAAGTYDFDAFFFNGYSGTGANAAVYNNSGGAVTINVLNGGDTPTVRNAASSTTTVNNSVTVSVSGVTWGTPVSIIADETAGTVTKGDVLSEGFANSSGIYSYSQNFEGAFGAGLDVVTRARNQGVAVAAISDDGGVFTDETSEASSNAGNDMTLLPSTPALNDAFYFGHDEEFSRLKLDITTVLTQTGAPTITWEYWNGSSWTALSGVSDGTNGYETSGENIVSWTAPGDWATTTVNSQGPLYYVRARLSVVGTITQAPQGGKVTLDVTRYLPYVGGGGLNGTRTITASGLSDIAAWQPDTISKFTQ